jgi:two-component system sensor histidine kinase CpxA
MGGGIEPDQEPHSGAALPIDLPNGERGAMFVVVKHADWRADRHPLRLWGGLALILGVVWLLSWPLAAHLTRPLRRLADAAERLGSGDLTIRSDLRRRDEIGRLAERFNRMADNLQRLVLGHKQLLSDVSHELRTPLARLRVALELARKEAGPAAMPYLERVEGQAEAMDELIGELLAFARLDASPDAFQPEPVDPRALLEEAARAHRAEAEARRIALSLHSEGAPASVPADRARLARALGNLLRNAIAHGPEGSTLHLTAGVEGTRLVFRVRDEGPGVPPEQRESIFQPFYRTDTARNRASGGVGLGLAIARRCMEAQGGGAYAEAGQGGVGLSVALWLPMQGDLARVGQGA